MEQEDPVLLLFRIFLKALERSLRLLDRDRVEMRDRDLISVSLRSFIRTMESLRLDLREDERKELAKSLLYSLASILPVLTYHRELLFPEMREVRRVIAEIKREMSPDPEISRAIEDLERELEWI